MWSYKIPLFILSILWIAFETHYFGYNIFPGTWLELWADLLGLAGIITAITMDKDVPLKGYEK